jgi:photosynthetic reaction center M subunit
VGPTFFSKLIGWFGAAQVGPFYLGYLGIASLVFGFIAIEIIGLNMWASVGWDPVEFVRQLPWLALEPPAAEQRPEDAAAQRGRLVAAGGLLPDRVHPAVVGADLPRAKALGMGTHVAWAFASAIWLYLVLGFFRPLLMGSWGEAVPFGIFPHLDWTAAFSTSLRQPLLQPVPRPLDRVPLRLDAALRDARRHRPRAEPPRR